MLVPIYELCFQITNEEVIYPYMQPVNKLSQEVTGLTNEDTKFQNKQTRDTKTQAWTLI